MEKLILTADLHCKSGIYVNVCVDYIDYLADYANNNGIKYIMFLGDILDKAMKIRNDCFIPLFKKMEELKDRGFILYFILGNHDIYNQNRDSIIETFSPFGTVISKPSSITIDNTVINLVPYTMDENEISTVDADYMFTHLQIADFDFGNKMIAKEHQCLSPSLFVNYKKVFTGHFHKRQELYNIQYIGSPYQLNFGDCGDTNKGFVVFEPATGNEEFIQYTSAPTYVRVDYDGLVKERKVDLKDLKNTFVEIEIDKKIDNFSKLRTILYKSGVIDITPSFKKPEKIDNKEQEIKTELNQSVKNMLHSFVSSRKFYYDKKEINGEDLLSVLEEVENEI